MTGGELTLGAVLARLEEREREIAAQAETTGEQIAQLTARLDELGRAAEEVRITRKTLRVVGTVEVAGQPGIGRLWSLPIAWVMTSVQGHRTAKRSRWRRPVFTS
ncbi:hypothetical protein AQJ43_28400 [Streptomyces avermitilis]|uniref:Uncharacterized protein n=1 Tax=Streptomyces avermitilis TaxID=33903 RepID=A0A4D4LX38_STRAX|nr:MULTISPECIES: hypothetical protein [Streptomyces]KUN51489.1 hypothetical protein AQJ43_28400 [Streptomyces avermitilis]MYS98209.1 hypothetical protein [Streptomyces sp. SID5469]BBJ50412.1 hypothetical protein SAVMC3_30410 [Streptomyces avermitilis]GDY62439.1 hypothetical protein SAV14893_018320 [Streptomyces avermitilis]GDY77453.1 hypothetical protein SAV31267_069380 [Streptomyces avermitilis]